jgi:hypothetical protein
MDERLVVSFGWTSLVTEHFKAALCVGRYALSNKAPGLKWVPIYPQEQFDWGKMGI